MTHSHGGRLGGVAQTVGDLRRVVDAGGVAGSLDKAVQHLSQHRHALPLARRRVVVVGEVRQDGAT